MAFEILDLARVLLTKRLEAADEGEATTSGKGKEIMGEVAESPSVRHIKERLADTHDLLAEISLENERYLTTAASLNSGVMLTATCPDILMR